MRLKTLLITLPLLTACGATAPTTSVVTYTTLSVFSDGGGVFRGLGNDTGKTLIGITPDVANVVASANDAASSDSPSGIDPSTFALVSSNSLGTIRQGSLTVGSTAVNVTVYENIGETSALLYLAVPSDGSQLLALGDELSGLPTGTFRYTGQQTLGVRTSGSSPEVGSFALDANFDSNTFIYSGVTDNTTLGGSGVIDSSSGRLASTALALTTPIGNYTATMHGLFQGASAAGVTGVYHTNDTNPDFAGGFVGSR